MKPRYMELVAASLRTIGDLPRYFLSGDPVADGLFNTLIALRRWPETVTYHMSTGRVPNYLNPKRYTEKVQWRKLFDRDPLLVMWCDKVESKAFARERVPDAAAPELLWVGIDAQAIPFDDLEPPYVVKANNRSSAIVAVWNEEDLDRDAVRAAANTWMTRRPHHWFLYEWAYSGVEPKILVERAIRRTDGTGPPPDYKVFVFDGEPFCLTVRDLETGYATIFDAAGTPLPWDRWKGFLPEPRQHLVPDQQPPEGFEAMIDVARRVAAGIDHLRVDLYHESGTVYFGEGTVYVSSGHKYFFRRSTEFEGHPPDDVDRLLGDLWKLPPLKRSVVLWRGLVGRRSPEG